MPPSFYDLLNATSLGGQQAFGLRGGHCVHLCLFCKREFEQTEEGWAALRQHHFEHGAAELFDWHELQGKTLRLVAVDSGDKYSRGTDLYGVDDTDGIVYHLAHGALYSDDTGKRGRKWKITNQRTPNDGPQPMPNVLALLSSGSESRVEK